MPNLQSDNHTQFRLPTEVKPIHYDIVIKTDLEKLEFQGIVIIEYIHGQLPLYLCNLTLTLFGLSSLNVKSDTRSLTFNSTNICITSVAVTYADGSTRKIDLDKLSFDESLEQATLALPTALKRGSKAALSIHYKRSLTNELRGYYYSKYEIRGQKRYYAVTQFEVDPFYIDSVRSFVDLVKPTAARRAFPCWDEPALKATFQVSMISRNTTVNLSNMPVVSETKVISSSVAQFFADDNFDGWKITKFERTPMMSTYIVALANGDFQYRESSYKIATEDLILQTQFCLDVKAKVLIQYEQAFDIEFALPKLDTLVAHEFTGAMENWGLIIGQPSALLVDPERTDLAKKQNIAGTQSHEVANSTFNFIRQMSQQFYVMVVGFATLMGHVIILNKLFPEWKVYSSFYDLQTSEALSLDARLSSHPIQVDIPNPNEIGQKALGIVLRMLSVYTGEERFLRGVSIYLKNHLYDNTVTADLWAGIQEATGLDIPGLMNNWISKTGYPVLTAKETESGIRIRQDRFLITGKAGENDNRTIWHVPLRIQTVNSKGQVFIDEQALLTNRETTYELKVDILWKLNAGGTGFYRVLYPPGYLVKLGQEASRIGSTLSTEDRLGLLNDAMTLATSGYSTTSSALTLIDTLKSVTEYLVWKSITSQVGSVIQSRSDKADEDDLRDFLRTIVAPLVKKMGYEYPPGEQPDTVQLRTTVISTAANSGLTETVRKLQEWFEIYLDTGSASHIPPDLISPTFKVATEYGGRREWEEMKKVFNNPSDPSTQFSALYAMCNTRDPVLIGENFDFILNSVPNHMIIYFFFGVATNDKIGKKVLSFLKMNYDEIFKKLDGTFLLSHLLHAISGALKTFQDAQELEDFFKDKDTSKINQSLSQALDLVRARAAWSEVSRNPTIIL
ncbi:hypothetical protein Clacol_004396 [Clathrus columnatus]|uniref:Aminopeptidase n=1 Tax=Clathrus columnatus TaxID=1419009 RepID=A0AAV5A7B4_9AGAM|nr:hypothetical protein Clacol_004396 [Clathrus columnatus]